MNAKHLRAVAVAAFTACLAACGTPGIPVPPSLELPRPITDLHAVRKGNKVVLSWTSPLRTTDGRNIRRAGPTQICRSIGAAITECTTPIATMAPDKTSGAPGSSFTDDISGLAFPIPTASLFYAVSALNTYGRSAGLSNKVEVPAAPVVPPPKDIEAKLSADGVHLTWAPISAPAIAGLQFMCRIYRREQGSNVDAIAGEITLGQNSRAALLDTGFQWEKTYAYRATIVTVLTGSEQRQVEGDDTPPVTVVAHDIFPPATPSGLQAVFSGPGQKPFIDLIWDPNTESDLAGYNIYRRESGGEAKKMNSETVKTSAFRDNDVTAGHEYFYSVSAVDVRANESARSGEASENVPEQ